MEQGQSDDGVDKVTNNAQITFSPYSDAKLLDKEVVYEDVYSESMTNLTSDKPSGVSTIPITLTIWMITR